MAHETKRLAGFVAATGYDELPADVIEAARVYILDNLASGCAGATTPWARMTVALGRELGSPGPCSVFGIADRLSSSYATLANGVMIGGFECDHAFVPGSAHPSAAVFPAVLAAAQRNRIDGKTFITSIALGYEVLCRIGLAATRAVEDEAGFHGPGTNAAFGAAAGVGKVLGLDSETIVNALGIAGSHGAGLLEFVTEGAMTKRLHVGRGSQMGLEAALLAAKGFTGPSSVLEGERGFLKVYSPSPHPARLVEGLGERYVMLDTTVKSFPCHISFHHVIDGLSRYRDDRGLGPDQVLRVTIADDGRMMEARHGQRDPSTVLGAQYSLPFSAAIALCRDVRYPSAYSDDVINDPQVLAMVRKVRLRGGAAGPTRVTVVSEDEEGSFTAEGWKGVPSNPYTYDEMARKFRHYATPSLAGARVADLVERVREIEGEPDMAAVARLIEA